jgi:hypothetical protein
MHATLGLRRRVRRAAACSWLWLPLVLGLPGAGAAAPGPAGAQALPAALDLADDALFAETLDPALTVQLLESGFVGVALRAPGHVDIDRRGTLPLLVATRFDGARDWALPFHDHARLVAIDLASGRVSVAAAFGDTKRQAPRSRGEKPSGAELGSFGAQLTRVDGRSRLDMPWQPGCWSFSLVYHDWLSEPVVVRLDRMQQGSTTPRSDAVCAAPSAGPSRVDFRRRGLPGGAVGIAGRFSVPVDALQAHRRVLPAALIVLARDGGAAQRHDWQLAVEVRPGAREVSGTIDLVLPAAGPAPADAVAYLVVAGQVHGPRRWTATGKPARQ